MSMRSHTLVSSFITMSPSLPSSSSPPRLKRTMFLLFCCVLITTISQSLGDPFLEPHPLLQSSSSSGELDLWFSSPFFPVIVFLDTEVSFHYGARSSHSLCLKWDDTKSASVVASYTSFVMSLIPIAILLCFAYCCIAAAEHARNVFIFGFISGNMKGLSLSCGMTDERWWWWRETESDDGIRMYDDGESWSASILMRTLPHWTDNTSN